MSCSRLNLIHSSAQLLQGRMVYRQVDPPADLADLVMDFWEIHTRSPNAVVPSQLFPTPCVRLRFMIFDGRVDSLVYGPSSSAHRRGLYVGHQVSFGATLDPRAALAMTGIPPAELRDLRIDMRVVWPGVEALAEQLHDVSFEERVVLFADFLRRQPLRTPRWMPRFEAAWARVSADARTVGPIARDLGVSNRTLDRYFQEAVGLSPKETVRTLRLQRRLSALTAPAAADVDVGFSDQSHEIREFRALIGVTPAHYLRNLDAFHDPHHPFWSATNAAAYDEPMVPRVHFGPR